MRKENGYEKTIRKGITAVRTIRRGLSCGTGSREENVGRLKKELETADAVVIGAGAGLSTSAGMTYSGERFDRYFFDFRDKYGITDMYSGGFYPFPDEETRWAWWARHIYYNRYVVDAKSILGIFSLDLSRPITLEIYAEDCGELMEKIRPFIEEDK